MSARVAQRFRWDADMVALAMRLDGEGRSSGEIATAIAAAATAAGMTEQLPNRTSVLAKLNSLRDAGGRAAAREVLAERVRVLAAQGLTRAQIGARLGYGVSWVDQMAQRYQITLPRSATALDRARDAEIRRRALAGESAGDIAMATGLAPGSIHTAAKRLGLKLRIQARVKPGGWQQPPAEGKREAAPPKPLPKLRQVTPAAKPLIAQCSLERLPEWTCHWPEGDPADAGFHFCARRVEARPPKTPGAPAMPATYCPDHTRLAYLPRRHTETIHKQARADLIACAAAAR